MSNLLRLLVLVAMVVAMCFEPALADQAAYISESYAVHASELLKDSTAIRQFCAPCGDSAATPVTVHSVEAADTGNDGYWEVRVNGQGVDLAYTYYFSGGKWANVAMAVGLKVSDVPEFIGSNPERVEASETESSGPWRQQAITYSKAFDICAERAGNEPDSVLDCIAAERKLKDAMLNATYAKLMALLPEDRQQRLRAAERLWIGFRTENCNFYLYEGGGTSALIASASCNLRMTAAREQELKSLVNMNR